MTLEVVRQMERAKIVKVHGHDVFETGEEAEVDIGKE